MTDLQISNTFQSLKAKFGSHAVLSYDLKGIPIIYIPVISHGDLDIGVASTGDWIVGDKLKVFPLNSKFHAAPALPILKISISDIIKKLKDSGFLDITFNGVENPFPFKEVVRIGLRQKSQYWAELALEWYASLEEKDKDELIDDLHEIVGSKWADQRFQHKVKKEMKKA